MFKSSLCLFWENNYCKFMNNPERCLFAHGIEDIQDNIPICKYGIRCNNSKCVFDHGKVSTIPNMVYDISIINKKRRNNKKNKTDNKKINVIENRNIKSEIVYNENINPIPNIPQSYLKDCVDDEIKTVKIINKEKCIKEEIYVRKEDYDKILSITDYFYIKKYDNMVHGRNEIISNIVKNNYMIIKSLRDDNNKKDVFINKLIYENNILKKINKELKTDNNKKNTISDVVEKNVDTIKITKLYIKYVNLYKLFKNNSYQDININEIRKYTKDKNIYKIKQRAEKINTFYNKFKNGIFKYCLPISKIIKMSF